MKKKRIVLIGPGRLGQAVARLLREAGHDIRAIISRDAARALAASRFAGCRGVGTTDLSLAREGELVLIALPDDQIGEMAATLRREGHLQPGTILIHFSGIHPAAILLGEEGPPLKALSIHPLQTFADAALSLWKGLRICFPWQDNWWKIWRESPSTSRLRRNLFTTLPPVSPLTTWSPW
jgi:prephenate dehydrogenase